MTGDTVRTLATACQPPAGLADRASTARDYVEGMWLMLQQEKPEDFVLATGETHPVREFVEKAFGVLGYNIK